jgi:hypothetical protein
MGHFSNALFILLSSCRVFLGLFLLVQTGKKTEFPKKQKTKKQKNKRENTGK